MRSRGSSESPPSTRSGPSRPMLMRDSSTPHRTSSRRWIPDQYRRPIPGIPVRRMVAVGPQTPAPGETRESSMNIRPGHRHGFRRGLLAITVVLTMVTITACGGTTDRSATADTADSPAPAAEAITLVVVHNSHESSEQMLAFGQEVERLSAGTLKIEFRPEWRMDEVEFEAGTVADVQAGRFDIGWLGARVFDEVGVTSFQALLAPLLIDSHDLQEAVFEAGIPGEMLAGLDTVGLTGIGVLPGPMRKVLGVSKPMTAPSDFTGTTIGHQDSAVAHQTLTALGAIAVARPTGSDLEGLDGYEQQLVSILGNHYEEVAKYVTANLNLWPRPLVIFMNGDAFDALSPENQRVLRDAATAITDDALAAARAEDADTAPLLCDAGLTLALASGSDLAGLNAAVQPVYAKLATDPQTKADLDAIAALKSRVGAPPDSAPCPPSGPAADSFVTPGRYEATIAAGTFTMVVEGEFLTILDPGGDVGFKGRYTTSGDRIEVSDGPDTVTARWSFDGKQIRFTDVNPEGSPFESVWEAKPWVLAEPAG